MAKRKTNAQIDAKPSVSFVDLALVFDGALHLPWTPPGGTKTLWRVEELSALEAERLTALSWSSAFTPSVELPELKKLLGPTWQALVDAGIGWSSLLHFARTALIYYTSTPEAAAMYWKTIQFADLVLSDLDATA